MVVQKVNKTIGIILYATRTPLLFQKVGMHVTYNIIPTVLFVNFFAYLFLQFQLHFILVSITFFLFVFCLFFFR